ncbi:S8 family peptidase [Arthrobacter sp. zg-Y750]|uniref:S8 family peptidase n=1 Tax=Arthrobacter sp. zg-Y750 TaxID=2894189 RepID=UPI001E53A38C|nr:S8 family peptidase [Arthrobacter sp. zg-Y750]MCC9178538.1 S8 family peptidase [Arthrobacter sp. zg-Y750]
MDPLTGVNRIPLVINLRDEALAKSNRPTEFLTRSGLSVEATLRTGEIVTNASQSTLANLADRINTPSTAKEIYAVSTFDSFSLWEPFAHATASGSGQEVVQSAAEDEKPLKLDFFPWLDVESPLVTGQPIRDYLEEEGFELLDAVGSSRRKSAYFRVSPSASASSLLKILGIRSAVLAPDYSAFRDIQQQSFRKVSSSGSVTIGGPTTASRPVGVLDTGVAVGALDPWVTDRETYDLGSDRDELHGTFVAGLIVASREINQNAGFPADTAPIVDGQVLPNGSITEHILLDRITEVVEKHAKNGPRVWNCSFAATTELNPIGYGAFAQAMDELSAKHNVLFVQAAGNYTVPPGRAWPPVGALTDGIASPAEAVHSLAVGSLAHLGGAVPVGSPASYSRRGPSFGGQQKPDVVHWSGDFGGTFGALTGHGIQSVIPGDDLAESVGTSFATPIVSAIAANTWDEIEASSGANAACPELVKGLLVHSAAVASPIRDQSHRAYFGAGVPTESGVILEDTPDSFTTVHEVNMVRGIDWFKDPFPVPACLLTTDGKLKAEIVMTVAYAPVVDAAFGDECVRSSVDASFGRMTSTPTGFQLKGLVPFEKGAQAHAWERDRVQMGKWSPIKTYRKKYPQGTAGGDRWALKLSLLERVEGEVTTSQRVFVILTFKGLSPTLPVYQDGLAAISASNYPSLSLRGQGQIRVQANG